jgi:hypothetical protein
MKMGAVADLPMAWSMHQCTSSTKHCAGRNSSLNVPQQLASPAVWLAVGGLVDAMFSAQAQAPPSNAAIMSIQLGDSLSASRSPGKHTSRASPTQLRNAMNQCTCHHCQSLPQPLRTPWATPWGPCANCWCLVALDGMQNQESPSHQTPCRLLRLIRLPQTVH